MQRNHNFSVLHSNYLFAEINTRKANFLQKVPDAKVISLGVGDTSLPIPQPVVEAWKAEAEKLGTEKGYTGYEPYQGRPELCKAIVERFYQGMIKPEEVFISDGSKCSLGRLQLLFPQNAVIGVQDPAYPVYIDTSVVLGHANAYDWKKSYYEGMVYFPCTKENDFFPDFSIAPPVDVAFICVPNNPTGSVPTRKQLEKLVEYARRNKTLIIYDSAYASFIKDPNLPKTIYEIEGAAEVAIEVGSFTKLAGFSGVRLGWVIVPHALKYDDGRHIHADWSRINNVFFNGASNIAQAGGLAVLSSDGWGATMKLIDTYLENARQLRSAISRLGLPCFGGEHAPYIWVEAGGDSWQMFDYLLEKHHLITTPGVGFGPSGQGYLRLSSLGKRSEVEEAVKRLNGIEIWPKLE